MRLSTILGVAIATHVACGTGVKQPDGGGDAATSADCLEAVDHSDLAWIQQKIFSPTCSKLNACHKGRAISAGGLNLEAGNAADNLVGKPSTLFPEQTLVIPNDPEHSYLMIVLGSYDGPLDPEVGTMPFNTPLLCLPKRLAIERWITSLVSNDPDAGAADAGVNADASPIDAL